MTTELPRPKYRRLHAPGSRQATPKVKENKAMEPGKEACMDACIQIKL
jgi:hypothetical protein